MYTCTYIQKRSSYVYMYILEYELTHNPSSQGSVLYFVLFCFSQGWVVIGAVVPLLRTYLLANVSYTCTCIYFNVHVYVYTCNSNRQTVSYTGMGSNQCSMKFTPPMTLCIYYVCIVCVSTCAYMERLTVVL